MRCLILLQGSSVLVLTHLVIKLKILNLIPLNCLQMSKKGLWWKRRMKPLIASSQQFATNAGCPCGISLVFIFAINLVIIFCLVRFMEQWPSGYDAGFLIQDTRVQDHWVAPISTQHFILRRSIKWVPGIPGNLVVKSKLPPWSGSSLEVVEPHP